MIHEGVSMKWEEENECERCSSPLPDGYTKQLCPFCYQTHLGNILRYNKQYSNDTVTLAQGICEALNLLLFQKPNDS